MSYLDLLGYFASLVVLISLLMSSILKLRWINLIGAVFFSIYGFLIHSIPTGVLNLGIVFIDIYYLAKIYGSKEYFHLLPTTAQSEYTKHFLEFYGDNIQSFFGKKALSLKDDDFCFYVLRNMVPAGLFVGERRNDVLEIKVDYVTPEYRDFKISEFIYKDNLSYFKKNGIKTLYTQSEIPEHQKYLKKIGFVEFEKETQFVKHLN